MAVEPNVSLTRFPAQDPNVGRRVAVTFNYREIEEAEGVLVRRDVSSPYFTMIRLDDGRHIGGAECRFRVLPA